LKVLAVLGELVSKYFQSTRCEFEMPAATGHPTTRFRPAGQPEGTLYRGHPGVIKPPMDVSTVIHRLKRGLYGSVRDLLLDVELFMANAIRSISPLPFVVSTSGTGQRVTSDGCQAAALPPHPL
jgi:hypothetical protein